MITCIDEISVEGPLPTDLLDAIFMPLLDMTEGGSASRALAHTLIARCVNNLQGSVDAVLSRALMQSFESDFVQENFLLIIYEINKIAPNMLVSSISQLESSIKVSCHLQSPSSSISFIS